MSTFAHSAAMLDTCSPQPPVEPEDWDRSSPGQLKCFTVCELFGFANEGNLSG